MHVLCEIHQEATSWILFFCFFHQFHLDSLLLMSPVKPFHFCPCICGLTLSCPSASVISPSSECVIGSVCRLSVCLRALLCKALTEWWKRVLFIRVREGESEGGMCRIDTIVKATCDSHKCLIKNGKKIKNDACITDWIISFWKVGMVMILYAHLLSIVIGAKLSLVILINVENS